MSRNDYLDYLKHSQGKWKKHKYIAIHKSKNGKDWYEYAKDAYDKTKYGISEGLNKLGNFAEGAYNTAKGAITNAVSNAYKDTKKATEKAISSAKSTAKKVGKDAEKTANKIKKEVKKTSNKISKTANVIKKSANKKLSEISSSTKKAVTTVNKKIKEAQKDNYNKSYPGKKYETAKIKKNIEEQKKKNDYVYSNTVKGYSKTKTKSSNSDEAYDKLVKAMDRANSYMDPKSGGNKYRNVNANDAKDINEKFINKQSKLEKLNNRLEEEHDNGTIGDKYYEKEKTRIWDLYTDAVNEYQDELDELADKKKRYAKVNNNY